MVKHKITFLSIEHLCEIGQFLEKTVLWTDYKTRCDGHVSMSNSEFTLKFRNIKMEYRFHIENGHRLQEGR